jgi:hypothetical protein
MVPALIRLLQAASEGRRDLCLAAFEKAQVCWAVERGLGPLLRYSTACDATAAMAPLWPLLESTDLTARILGGEQLDAMAEIIDACGSQAPLLTLLKGISISEQYYPQAYLRPMRDIDFFVEEAYHPAVESILCQLGYRQQSPKPVPAETFEHHHHSMPFYHPQRGVWVEIHRGLVSGNQGVATDQIFRLEHVKSQLRPSEFQGRQVYRFSNEFQLAYISAHWGAGRTIVDGMIAMLDIIYLLRNAQEAIDWGLLRSWLQGSTTALYLAILLTYLRKYQLIDIPPAVPQQLCIGQNRPMGLNLKILQLVIDYHVVAGKDFSPHCSAKDFDHVWRTLLLPGPPIHNLILVMRHFLRLRTRLSRVARLTTYWR